LRPGLVVALGMVGFVVVGVAMALLFLPHALHIIPGVLVGVIIQFILQRPSAHLFRHMILYLILVNVLVVTLYLIINAYQKINGVKMSMGIMQQAII
jgi:hypothetical protein